jgi:hypothetical protein
MDKFSTIGKTDRLTYLHGPLPVEKYCGQTQFGYIGN